jgi:hypothetical protein
MEQHRRQHAREKPNTRLTAAVASSTAPSRTASSATSNEWPPYTC